MTTGVTFHNAANVKVTAMRTHHCVIRCFFLGGGHLIKQGDLKREMWALCTRALEYNVHLFYPE